MIHLFKSYKVGVKMFHCPYCGSIVKEDESFCIKCGKELPDDLNARFNQKKHFNRYWLLPIFCLLICVVSLMAFFFILQHQETTAKQLFNQGESFILEEDYSKAKEAFSDALTYKDNFFEANVALNFTNKVLQIEEDLKQAMKQQENNEFKESLDMINAAERTLQNYHGSAVDQLIDQIIIIKNDTKVEQLKYLLSQQPNIDELKSLLWESEAINNLDAEEITNSIRNQIVDYTFSKASEQLNNKQFNDAQILVDDGLKYAGDSEKLLSLQTTIEKEKTAFETEQQQRIEQAIHLAAEEDEKNKEDAIKLNSVKITKDDQDNWIVNGKVTSVATIPINSVLIEYSLLTNKDEEIETNKVYVFPDKLYMNEEGKFEFTHYDIDKKHKKVKVKVNKITWYTD